MNWSWLGYLERRSFVCRWMGNASPDHELKIHRRTLLGLMSLFALRPSQAASLSPPAPALVVRYVEEFGAKGDGETDDTEAIQSALSQGGAIRFSSGRTYVVRARSNDILQITKGGTHLLGDENAPPILVYREADASLGEDIALLSISSASVISNVSVMGLHFLCARKRYKLTSRPLIYAQNVRSFTFEGNVVENASYGVFLRNVSDFRLTRNRILHSVADGIQASNQGSQASGTSLTRGEISHNHFQFNGDDCIAVGSQVDQKGKRTPSEIVIHHNFCERQGPQGGGIGIYGSEGIQVYNNVIIGASKHGIAIITDTNNRQETNQRIVIENNTIVDVVRSDYSRDKYYNCAIVVGNRNSGGDSSYLAGPFADDVQIRSNAIYSRNRNGIVVSVGERFRGRGYLAPANVAISDNLLVNNSDHGAEVAAFIMIGAEDVKFSDNYVVGYDK